LEVVKHLRMCNYPLLRTTERVNLMSGHQKETLKILRESAIFLILVVNKTNEISTFRYTGT